MPCWTHASQQAPPSCMDTCMSDDEQQSTSPLLTDSRGSIHTCEGQFLGDLISLDCCCYCGLDPAEAGAAGEATCRLTLLSPTSKSSCRHVASRNPACLCQDPQTAALGWMSISQRTGRSVRYMKATSVNLAPGTDPEVLLLLAS